MTTEALYYSCIAAAVLIMVIYYSRRRKKISSVLFGALSGLAALILVNKYGPCFDAGLPLNMFNLCGSALLGVPFVIGMVILRFL